MDPDNYDVSVGGENVSLTAREFEILRLLLENQGRVFSRDSLLDRIWGYDYFGDEKDRKHAYKKYPQETGRGLY